MTEFNLLQRHADNDYTLRNTTIPKLASNGLLIDTMHRCTLLGIKNLMLKMKISDEIAFNIAKNGENNYDISIFDHNKSTRNKAPQGTTVQGSREVLLKLIPDVVLPAQAPEPNATMEQGGMSL